MGGDRRRCNGLRRCGHGRVSSGSLATTAARVVVVVAGACAVVGGGYLAHRAWNNHRRRVAKGGGRGRLPHPARSVTFNAAYEQTGVDPMLTDARARWG